MLPLLYAYAKPKKPIRGALALTELLHAEVRAAKVGADKDIPHVSRQLIDKYVNDLPHLGVI